MHATEKHFSMEKFKQKNIQNKDFEQNKRF
jgi:hypothetical protein